MQGFFFAYSIFFKARAIVTGRPNFVLAHQAEKVINGSCEIFTHEQKLKTLVAAPVARNARG